MLGFLTSVGSKAADPLSDVAAAEAFWRMLPQDDPIAAQSAVCEALADPVVARGSPNVGRLRALLALDQRARMVVDRLLFDDGVEDGQARSLGTQSRQAAFELCRSLGRAHGELLRSMRDGPGYQGVREHMPYVLLRLFQHRQIELLLRPFVDERSTRFSWKEVHEAYRLAQSSGLLHDELPVNRRHSPHAEETTLEREYIQVLLQDLMNGGHFPPRDALRASQCLPRWCRAAALESHQVRSSRLGFVVDLDGDAGLARRVREAAGTCVGFDTAPVLASIRHEIASLRNESGGPGEGASTRHGRQLRLLGKVSALFAPERPVIARRGERKPAALTVEVAVGMVQILRQLRDKPERAIAAPPRSGATVDDGTITALDTTHPPLTMVDRSDSGCRLHGPALAAIPIMPGVLIAFREGPASPWTLAVVRRVRKRLAGKRIEIGVEYVGNDPRRIVVVVPDSEARPDRPPGSEQPRFAALYLPESARHPVLPIRTLITPVRGLAPGDRLSVRSGAAAYTIQLKEPLEEQSDFVWSPFDVLDCLPMTASYMPG